MLTIENLGKQFNKFHAVHDFSLTVAEGEFVTLLGPSGSGKTTVLRMVAGLEQPSTGIIRIAGQDVTRLPTQKRNIGLVFQSYALFPNMSVTDNIAFPLRVRRYSRERIAERVTELLELMGLSHRAQYAPDQLSGGEKQRVALARALAFHPPLLLLDEPLSALDAKVRQSLRRSLKEIQRTTGVTTVMVTHDQEEALELSDRIVVMAQGQVEQIGTPLSIYYAPETDFAAQFIGEINTIHVSILGFEPIDREYCAALLSWQGHTVVWKMRQEQIQSQGDLLLRVRPESFHVVPPQIAGAVRAQVISVTFMGGITRLLVNAGEAHVLVDVLSSSLSSVKIGEEIGLQLIDQRVEDSVRANVLQEAKR